MAWRPLFKKLQDEHSGDVLHEGVPDWLWSSLVGWLSTYISDTYGPSEGAVRDIERQCRVPLNWRTGVDGAADSLLQRMMEDHDLALEVINLVLSYSHRASTYSERETKLTSLEIMLEGAGSAWRDVGGDPPHLEKRVPDEVRDRYLLTARQGRPAEHLRQAWKKMYGRDPDPSSAYREAVRAVEAAATPVILPDDANATLGKMIGAIRDKPEKWSAPLGDDERPGSDVIREMMGGVWYGQHDRHGTPDQDRPISVNAEEAEAALHVAITLVHLLDAGLMRRV